MVSSALGFLLLLVLAECWSMASRAWSQADQVGSVQRSTLALSYRLRQDYLASMPGSLHLDPNLTSFLSDDALSWDSTGSPQWSHWVQFRYTPSAGTVERRTVALASSVTTPPSGPPPGWPSNVYGDRLAEGVTLFDLSVNPTSQCLTIHLRSQLQQSSSRVDLGVLPQLYGQD